MKIYSMFLAVAFLFAGMATIQFLGPAGAAKFIAPAVAATPPGGMKGPIAAQCAKGFTANPASYTTAQLGGAGVKYSCTESVNANARSPFAMKGFVYTCSGKFSHLTQGDDAPSVKNGKAVYFCISSGPN